MSALCSSATASNDVDMKEEKKIRVSLRQDQKFNAVTNMDLTENEEKVEVVDADPDEDEFETDWEWTTTEDSYSSLYEANRKMLAPSPQLKQNQDQWLTEEDNVVALERLLLHMRTALNETYIPTDFHLQSFDHFVRFQLIPLVMGMPAVSSPSENGMYMHKVAFIKARVTGPLTTLAPSKISVTTTQQMIHLLNSSFALRVVVDIYHAVQQNPAYQSSDGTSATRVGKKATKAQKKIRSELDDMMKSDRTDEWKIVRRRVLKNVTLWEHPIMTMCRTLDPRATGYMSRFQFASEDPMDIGGTFLVRGIDPIRVPPVYTEKHNVIRILDRTKDKSIPTTVEATKRMILQFRVPDHAQFTNKELDAQAYHNFLGHDEHICATIWSRHASKEGDSTKNLEFWITRPKQKGQLDSSFIFAKFAFWDSTACISVLFALLGVPPSKVMPMIQRAAGVDWYPSVMQRLLDQTFRREGSALHAVETGRVEEKDIEKWARIKIAALFEEHNSNSAKNKLDAWSDERSNNSVDLFESQQLFPHIGVTLTPENRYLKAQFLAHMVWTLLMRPCGFLPSNPSHNESNRRIDVISGQEYSWTRKLLAEFSKNMVMTLRAHMDSAGSHFDEQEVFPSSGPSLWTTKLNDAMLEGRSAIDNRRPGGNRSQVTVRATRPVNNSQQNVLATGIKNCSVKVQGTTEATKLDPEQFHRRAMSETQERKDTGRRTNLTMGSMIGIGTSYRILMSMIARECKEWIKPVMMSSQIEEHEMDAKEFTTQYAKSGAPVTYNVLVDGVLCWVTNIPEKILKKVTMWIKAGLVGPHVSVYLEGRVLHVCSQQSRHLRPVVDLESLCRQKQSWKDTNKWANMTVPMMYARGLVRYVDAREQKGMLFTFSPRDWQTRGKQEQFTHMNVSSIFMRNVREAAIPFVSCINPARINLGVNMCGQAAETKLQPNTITVNQHELHYGVTSPITPGILRDFGWETTSYGALPEVALIAQEENQEDAKMFCRSALDLGMFMRSSVRNFSSGFTAQSAMAPDKLLQSLPQPKYRLKAGDVIISRNKDVDDPSDKVTIVREENAGIVESCQVINKGSLVIPNVCVRTTHSLKLADKAADRQGRKGLNGFIYSAEDAPFRMTGQMAGLAPDMIANPNGIIGRLSLVSEIQMLINTLCLQLGVAEGEIDATGHMNTDQKTLLRKLKTLAKLKGVPITLKRHDWICGKTGRRMHAITCGYQEIMRLLHDANTKSSIRGKEGKRDPNTNQPTAGRAKDGGSKQGINEVDNTTAHGLSQYSSAFHCEQSDQTLLPICSKCRMIAEYNHKIKQGFCYVCMRHDTVGLVKTVYGAVTSFTNMERIWLVPLLTKEESPSAMLPDAINNSHNHNHNHNRASSVAGSFVPMTPPTGLGLNELNVFTRPQTREFRELGLNVYAPTDIRELTKSSPSNPIDYLKISKARQSVDRD